MVASKERILLRLVISFPPLVCPLFPPLSLSVFLFVFLRLLIQKGSSRMFQSRVRSTNETNRELFHFLPTLAALGDSSEGVLTWDAMTLSTFQKYDCTLARHTARGEFSGCLHRWRSCCECHSGPLVASYDAPFSRSWSTPINLSPVLQILNDRILRSFLTSLPFLSLFSFGTWSLPTVTSKALWFCLSAEISWKMKYFLLFFNPSFTFIWLLGVAFCCRHSFRFFSSNHTLSTFLSQFSFHFLIFWSFRNSKIFLNSYFLDSFWVFIWFSGVELYK